MMKTIFFNDEINKFMIIKYVNKKKQINNDCDYTTYVPYL